MVSMGTFLLPRGAPNATGSQENEDKWTSIYFVIKSKISYTMNTSIADFFREGA